MNEASWAQRMRAAIGCGLALTIGCGGGRRATAPSTAPSTCRALDDVVAVEQELAARNEQALAQALAAAGLRLAPFAADVQDGDGGRWEVVEERGRRALLSPAVESACGFESPARLVLDDAGDVYALEVQHRPVLTHDLLICGCPADVPITCGGMARRERARWVLPAGATFKGVTSVVVNDETGARDFAGRADGRPCPVPVYPP